MGSQPLVEIHRAIITTLDNENRLSRHIDDLLDRKYGKQAIALLIIVTAEGKSIQVKLTTAGFPKIFRNMKNIYGMDRSGEQIFNIALQIVISTGTWAWS